MRVLSPTPDPQPWVPVPGSAVPITFGCKNQQGLWLSEKEGSWIPRHSSSRTLTETYSDSLALSHSTGAAAQRMPGTYGESLNCLSSGQEMEGQLSSRQKCSQRPLFLWWALPPQSQQAGTTMSEFLSTWLSLFTPTWWFTEIPPNPTFWPTQAVSSGFSIWMACLRSCQMGARFIRMIT